MENLIPYFNNFSSYQEKLEKASSFVVSVRLVSGNVTISSAIPFSPQMLDDVNASILATTFAGDPFTIWQAGTGEIVTIPAAQIELIRLQLA
jgi:type II secretory pathway component GspD/PulD (secretin)